MMALDGFFDWLGRPEGQLSEQALFEVMVSLQHCFVEPSEQVIVWDDGKRLKIAQTAHRIHLQSNLPLCHIESHVIGWLEMHYEPKGLNEQQMKQFEIMIDDWIQHHQNLQCGELNLA